MSTLQRTIRDKFLKKLGEEPGFDTERIEKLQALLSAAKKPKPEELMQIFSTATEGEVK